MNLTDDKLTQYRSPLIELLTLSFPYESDGCDKKVMYCKFVVVMQDGYLESPSVNTSRHIMLQLMFLEFEKVFLERCFP
jgi:hypothetical protein